ncbi:MAG: hypothetical protein IID37_08125 [Planctomycetes bacterium]|nr:hypothetical protein [Planctomycetota bacterium]
MSKKASIENHGRNGRMELVWPVGIVVVAISLNTWVTGVQEAQGQMACQQHCTVCDTTNEDVCEGRAVYYQDDVNQTDPLVPLIDLADPGYRYQDEYAMGLYIDDHCEPDVQQNTIPDGHKAAGLVQGGFIVPRDATGGNTCDGTGLIGVLSIGFSNVFYEFQELTIDHIEPLVAPNLGGLNPHLVFVNGAKLNNQFCEWEVVNETDPDNPWGNILINRLPDGRQPGHGTDSIVVTAEQIQVIWVKLVEARPWGFCTEDPRACGCGDPGPDCDLGDECFGNPPNLNCGCDDDAGGCCAYNLCGDPSPASDTTGCRFPNWVFGVDGEVEKFQTVLKHMRVQFKNLRQVFISSRIYGGWANEFHDGGLEPPDPCGSGNPEPYAYVNGITVQELMRLQIFENPPELMEFGALDPYPYFQWGPYLWGNGTLPDPNGGTWECHEFCADGAHPSRDGDVVECDDPETLGGQSAVAQTLFDFFKTDVIASEWFLQAPFLCSTSPSRGFTDRLEDFDSATGIVEQGIKQIVLTFNEEVQKPGGGAVDTSCFTVTSTCSDPDPACVNNVLPTVSTVVKDSGNPKRYTITLNKQIVPGHWTTLIAGVEDLDGNAIRPDPHDRLDLAFLPGDADANRTVDTADYTRIDNVLTATYTPADNTLHDQNRDSSITTADKTREQALLNGTKTTRAWNGYTLPARP